MVQALDILKMSGNNHIASGYELVDAREMGVPGSAQYNLRRYNAPNRMAEDMGMMVYHCSQPETQKSYLELRFCTLGNRYCSDKSCNGCQAKPAEPCSGKEETLDVFTFHFSSAYLQQFTQNLKLTNRKDEVLAFKHPYSFTKTFPLCNRKKNTLSHLTSHSYSGALENIFTNSKVHELLLHSLECLVDEKEEGFACKFLADEGGRNRIYQAREILLQHIGEPITIKELSRKVAMNECYLKKGFKEVFGTTIFDFYQQQRMEHAKYLLYEKSLSVTDVSALLGYSSISHFSAAFKKHTGLKPCELLR
jgi:AraC-like DNA-binding protein